MTDEKFHEERRSCITGTDISAILGLNPYKTALEVYLSKTGELPPDDASSEAALWGNLLEGPVADEYARRTESAIEPVPFIRHPDMPFIGGHPDRIAIKPGSRRLVEIKTAGVYAVEKWQDSLPPHYLVQGLFYLPLVGLEQGDFALLIGGQHLKIMPFENDPETIEMLYDEARNFWEKHVLAHVPPPIEDALAHKDILNRLFPKDSGIQVQLPGEAAVYLRKLAKINRLEGLIKKVRAASENQIKEMLGEASTGLLDGDEVVTWKNTKDKVELDVERLQGEAPDVYRNLMRKFSRTKPGSRRFMPKYAAVANLLPQTKHKEVE